MVVIVGPNNSGKTTLLHHLLSQATTPTNDSPIIAELKIEKSGEANDVIEFVAGVSKLSADPNTRYSGIGYAFHKSDINSLWNRDDNILGNLTGFFFKLLSTKERLGLVDAPQNIDLDAVPTHPIHKLQDDDGLEISLSNIVREGFDKDVIVDHRAGRTVPLRIGDRPPVENGEHPTKRSYLGKIRELPYLHEEGDGIKSFVGVLIHTALVDGSVKLIDEPEAFLHPPQAKLVGRTLVEKLPQRTQLFLATHDIDVLIGVLSAENISNRPVYILRLKREAELTTNVLDSKALASIWADPLLRYSRILDGVFHRKTIVCEGDADCGFYEAVADSIQDQISISVTDVLFTHVGGKQRVSKVVRTLLELDIDVASIVDFDVFREKSTLKELVEVHGGQWSRVETPYRILVSGIENKKTELSASEVREKVISELDAVTSTVFPPKAGQAIRDIVAGASPWGLAKRAGRNYVPSGEASKACAELLNYLASIGLFVVPIGECEGFVRTVAGHGGAWLASVLETKDLRNEPELSDAREFVAQVMTTTPPLTASISC